MTSKSNTALEQFMQGTMQSIHALAVKNGAFVVGTKETEKYKEIANATLPPFRGTPDKNTIVISNEKENESNTTTTSIAKRKPGRPKRNKDSSNPSVGSTQGSTGVQPQP